MLEAKQYAPRKPLAGPVGVVLNFYMTRPVGHYVKGENKGVVKCRYETVEHTCRPDLDNLAKPVLDVLTRLGFWEDDSQIIRMSLEKLYEDRYDDGDSPGVWIDISKEGGTSCVKAR